MKRLFHLLAQAVLSVIVWVAIFETGFRLQQYFGPLYDLEMADVNLNWESDVVNHQPTPENQNLCIYGDSTGLSTRGHLTPTASGSSTTRRCWPIAGSRLQAIGST
jgi:hypothetical protein